MSTAGRRKPPPSMEQQELTRLRQMVALLEQQLARATVDSIVAKADARALEAKCSGLEMALYRVQGKAA